MVRVSKVEQSVAFMIKRSAEPRSRTVFPSKKPTAYAVQSPQFRGQNTGGLSVGSV